MIEAFQNINKAFESKVRLGIADCFFEGHGLMFWTIGFGGFHILYGMLFYLQYERRK